MIYLTCGCHRALAGSVWILQDWALNQWYVEDDMSLTERVIEETRSLSDAKAREVLDFILFLKQKDDSFFMAEASETSLSRIWDSPEEDEAWKDL